MRHLAFSVWTSLVDPSGADGIGRTFVPRRDRDIMGSIGEEHPAEAIRGMSTSC